MSVPTIAVKLSITEETKAKLDVMGSARGMGVSEFVTFLVDQADRQMFHGKAAELVAEQRKAAADPSGN
jgi:hypothetical protein